MDVTSYSTAREEPCDEVSSNSTTIEDPKIPPKSMFKTYGQWALDHSRELFKTFRTYEKPYKNYYVVITPYGRNKGADLQRMITIVRRWGSKRVIITRETKHKTTGKLTNPHYNIVITTRKKLKSSNANNLNINVQKLPRIPDIERAIDYCFKEYIKPLDYCIDGKHYYVWQKDI